ncbi:MAG: Vps62-related protein [Gammaproteobacteria bacterium]|nr:Vps62-related protein [Gammaproteobacteria bacterium]
MRHHLTASLVTVLLLLANGANATVEAGRKAFEARDYATALREWTGAAQSGDPKALNGLGLLFESGLGVSADPVTAHVLYNLAAFKGDAPGTQARDALEKRMTPQEIQLARRTALDLVEQRRYVPDTVTAAASGPAPKPAPRSAPVPTAAPPVAAAPPPPAMPRKAMQVERVCRLDPRWEDRGSGGEGDVALYQPAVPPGYFAIGGYAQRGYAAPDGCVKAIMPATPATAHLLAPPLEWRQVWADKGSGALKDGSIWMAVPPAPEFVCLGTVGQSGYGAPVVPDYRCVHRCLTEQVAAAAPIWTDAGTGAKAQVSLYRLHKSNSFVAFPARSGPAQLVDLDAAGNNCPAR